MNTSLLALVMTLIMALQSGNVPPDLRTKGLQLAQTVLTYIQEHPESSAKETTSSQTVAPTDSGGYRYLTLKDGRMVYTNKSLEETEAAYKINTPAQCDGLDGYALSHCVDESGGYGTASY